LFQIQVKDEIDGGFSDVDTKYGPTSSELHCEKQTEVKDILNEM
jgi:hypothetical protein